MIALHIPRDVELLSEGTASNRIKIDLGAAEIMRKVGGKKVINGLLLVTYR